MPTCAVCPTFVAEAADFPEMLTDVLYHFVGDNDFRLAIDRSGRVLELFLQVAASKGDLAHQAIDAWVRLLARMHHRAIERVNYSGHPKSHTTFTLGLARRIRGNALVIVWSMQDYDGSKLHGCGVPIADRHEAVRLCKESQGRKGMIDIATAGFAIKTIASAVGTVDKLYDVFRKFREGDEVSRPSGKAPAAAAETVTAGDQDRELIHSVRGQETKRVTREDLAKMLNREDLTFVSTYEKRMSDLYGQWVDISQEIELASGMQRAQLKAQIGLVADRIAECLRQIFDFLQKIGFQLDDHYRALRQIAGT
jgi:hypothetical protein